MAKNVQLVFQIGWKLIHIKYDKGEWLIFAKNVLRHLVTHNAPPSKVIKTCSECGQEFIIGDEYFQTEYGDFCDYHFHDTEKGKIIVTVEGDGIGEEMEKMKLIQKIPHVICADMMMAYSEDELDAEREKLVNSPDVPHVLNDENINLKDITYYGDLKKKIN